MAGGITRALLDTSVVIGAADSIALDPEQTAAIPVIMLIIATAAATGRVLHTRDSAQAQLAAAVGIPTRP